MYENLTSWTMTDPNSRRTISPNAKLTVSTQYNSDSGGRVYKSVYFPDDYSIDFDLTYVNAYPAGYGAVGFGYPLIMGNTYTSTSLVPGGLLTVYTSSAYYIQSQVGFHTWGLGTKKYCRMRRVGTTVYFERWTDAARTSGFEQNSWADDPVTTINYIILSQDANGGIGVWSSYIIENVNLGKSVGGGAIMY